MKAASGDKVIDRLLVSRGNNLNFKALEVFFFGLIVAVVLPAFEQLTDRNSAVPTDGHWEGIDQVMGTGVEVFKTGSQGAKDGDQFGLESAQSSVEA